MINKFNQLNKNPILICVVDNRDIYQSGWATEVAINITDFLVHRFIMKDYDIYIGKDENELLREASTDIQYSHAVVIAMGTSLGLSDRLFPAIEKLCAKDFFIAGHILERNEQSYYQNAYYEMHHQFYAVRLNDYRELGCPEVGQPVDGPHTQIAPIRSEECLYGDHEVAAWIKPGTETKIYNSKLHGWNIIATALANNKTVIDLGSDIRDSKKYLYYEYDHVFLRQVSEVYHNHFFCNNFFASWNSDQFKSHIPFDGPVEQYVTVGIGVYWITYLERLGTTSDTRVVFTDINYNCLMFMKKMVEHWDGKDYHKFYQENMPILPSGTCNKGPDVNSYIEYTRKEWEAFIAARPNWLDTWNKIKQLNFDYVLIDYMSDYELDFIHPNKRTLINLSDVFTHGPYIATQSLKYRISCENKLFNKIKKHNPKINIMMTSRASDGYLSSVRTLSGSVDQFELTDINQLKRLPWHEQDWQSPRMLG